MSHLACVQILPLLRWPIRPAPIISGFCRMKRPRVFLSPPPHGRVTPGIKFASTHLYTCVGRDTVRIKRMPKNTTECPRPELEPGSLNRETSALTMRPPHQSARYCGKIYSCHLFSYVGLYKPDNTC